MKMNANNAVEAGREPDARERILAAALSEFSGHGLAGARMDAIALAAGVNKALLYYYFASKDGLYLAALEAVATKVRDASLAAATGDATPGHRVVRTALAHFDRILTQHEFQQLMQQEMIRIHKGEPGAMSLLVEKVFRPLVTAFEATVTAGVASGELIPVDWLQMWISTLGANVFFFLTARMFQQLNGEDPLTPDALEKRRKALVEYLGWAIFRDREAGARVAAEVLAATPMPPKIQLPRAVEAR